MSCEVHKSPFSEDLFSAVFDPQTVIRCNEPLARKTTMGAGGSAKLYAEPATRRDLIQLITQARQLDLPWFVVGRGSNIIVPDDGYAGLVIRLNHANWRNTELTSDGNLHAGAGARLQQLCAEACRLGLAGFEFLEGIPGTLGGALRMNAGAMGSWMYDVVVSVELLQPDGQIIVLQREQLNPVYRKCPELLGNVALSAVLRGSSSEQTASIREVLTEFANKRKSSQPREPSAGCLFKNPDGAHAGMLIDRCGLKGLRVGNAEVSAVHANFVVNRGDAKTADIIILVKKVRETVQASTGHLLEPEAILLGKRWEDVL